MNTACRIILPLSHLIYILIMIVSFAAGIFIIVMSVIEGPPCKGHVTVHFLKGL